LSKLGLLADRLSWVREWLTGLPRPHKRLLLAGSDLVLLTLALWCSLSFRMNLIFQPPSWQFALLLAMAPVTTVATFSWFGLYRLVTRYVGPKGTQKMALCVGLSVLLWGLLVLMSGIQGVPRSVVLAYGFIGFGLVYMSRQLAAWLLKTSGVPVPRIDGEQRAVIVYGAGPTGVQILEALRRSGDARVAGFIDEHANMQGQYVSGVKVYRPEKVAKLIERENVKEVILAIPEAQRRDRRAILKELERFPVRVKTLPAIEDFAAGRVGITDLRPIEIADLLGRDPVPPNSDLLARGIRGKAVMVTGAGGSIGSELVRQILRHGPASLVLLEMSEVALYEIDMEVREHIAGWPLQPAVTGVLGSVLDEALVRETIRRNRVETIYHAAAYKHVPIVEQNPVAGLLNNAFGTAVVAEAARTEGVERVVLISTDKAVRPTNIMGASKRLSELILQAHAEDRANETVFTMVRFGNVLDSSGSVVRLFRKQIEAGGPVTVTHPEVIRYFMSIPEAADLVLHAGAMATGGDVFVLDMGEPVRIDELARSMIRLMGLEVRDETNPEGDVAIEYVGLRPGEKLYEELLIGDGTTPTDHPRIMRMLEPSRPADELKRELEVLRKAMAEGQLDAIQAVLLRTVEDYQVEAAEAEPATSARKPIGTASRMIH
jgi:FlaA1/EpsC-like NDP-sugar epimerase